MSARHRALMGPSRIVVPPEPNVVNALKAICDMVDALTARVDALEAANRPRQLKAVNRPLCSASIADGPTDSEGPE